MQSPWAFFNLKQKQEELRKKLNNKSNLKNKINPNNKNKKLNLSPPCYNDKPMTDYFNRLDVKKALHVNTDITWEICSGISMLIQILLGKFVQEQLILNILYKKKVQFGLIRP